MNTLQLIHIGCFAVCFSIFANQFILNLPIDISLLDSECVSDTIGSKELCDIVVGNHHRGILLRNPTLSPAILRAKFKTFFANNNFPRFLIEQIGFVHIFNEAILNQRFILCLGFMAMCMAIIEILVVKRMGILIRNRKCPLRKAYEDLEHVEWRICLTHFVFNKILVLLFCIARTPEPPMNKHYVDFGEYVRDTLSLRSRYTDTTLFACFYCLHAIAYVSTNTIFFRYHKTVYVLKHAVVTRLRFQPVFIVLFMTLTSLVAMSGTLLGGSFVSIGFLHPDYSMILVLESAILFIRSLYVLDRLAQSVSASRMALIERQKRLTHEEISELLATGFQTGVTRKTFHYIYVHSTLLMTILLNLLFLKNGMFSNEKLLAICFVFPAVQALWSQVNYDKILPIDLL